jgi:hypothetical protein
MRVAMRTSADASIRRDQYAQLQELIRQARIWRIILHSCDTGTEDVTLVSSAQNSTCTMNHLIQDAL